MKKEIEKVGIFVVFGLLFGMFFVGGVSGETNYALGGTPQFNKISIDSWSNCNSGWVGSATYINDGEDENNYIGAWGSSSDYGCRHEATYEGIVNFATTVSEINKIEYKRYGLVVGNYQEGVDEKTFLKISGTWQEINSTGFYEGTATEIITSGGPWYNVEGVKVKIHYYAESYSTQSRQADSRLYELRAIGPELCTPTLDCSDYPGQCGVGLNDGCEDILDCSANCGSGETCQTGVCVSENPSCSDDDRIMRLFSEDNTHGALWNDTNGYNYEICCEDIFGVGAPECNPTTPHPISCANPVLWLNDTYNSHASTYETSTYNIPVCYGDLNCVARNDNCEAGEEIVVTLAQNTNSHISNASDTSYPIKICCTAEMVGNVYWADMDGTPLTGSNNNAEIGDTVLMVLEESGLSEGELDFTIEELSWANEWVYDNSNPIKGVVDANGKAVAKWEITQEDYAKTTQHERYIFHVQGFDSNELEVLDIENNSPPLTQIIKPIAESNYTIATVGGSTNIIGFNQTSSDEDDDLQIIWDFGDASNSDLLMNCLTFGNCNTTHTYSNPGTKTIALTAKEMTRAQSARDYSRIYVYKLGYNIFAIIDKPNIQGLVNAGLYDIDGTSSHVAYCEQTCSSPCSSCYTINDNSGGTPLECCTVADSSQLSFEWIFDGEVSDEESVSFQKLFVEPKEG